MTELVNGGAHLPNGHVADHSRSSPSLSAQPTASSPRSSPGSAMPDPPLQTLLSTLSASPHAFILPPAYLHTAALELAKLYLDPLAARVSAVQRARFLEKRDARRWRGRGRKRGWKGERGELLGRQGKRRRLRNDGYDDVHVDGDDDDDISDEVGVGGGGYLKLQSVHVDGFGTEQVWGQARRVLEAVCGEVERGVRVLKREVGGLERGGMNRRGRDMGIEDGGDGSEEDDDDGDDDEESEDEEEDAGEYEDEGIGEEGDEVELEDKDGDSDEDDGYKAFHGEKLLNGKRGRSSKQVAVNGGETLADGSSDIDMDEEATWDHEDEDDGEPAATAPQSYVADPHGLNDGFFSIDDFNRQSEFLERVDARGDPDDGAASDEEDVDWTMDPLAMDGGIDELDNDEDDAEEDTNVHLDRRKLINGNANGESDGSSVDEDDINGVDIVGNANNVMYKDFFEPPPKPKSKKKERKSDERNHVQGRRASPSEAIVKPDIGQNEIERAISTVQRDLFDEESSAESDRDDVSEKKAAAISTLSSHQRRQARLVEQIRQLEAENVAKREWTLSGEAKANERPLNSLLEEDLDFERVGKPAPVITAEVSEDLETLIKRRIIDREFDELRRFQPGALLPGQDIRRGRVQVDDSKPKKGLADEYEEEHLRRTDPNFVDVKDEKLRAKHREIEGLWREVSGKLDALASWHYRPKPAEASFEVRVDAPAITMEDAQPTAGSDVAGASRLAPQEIYTPGKQYVDGSEVVTKGGFVVKRDEMTREQKKRRRRREKERIRKASGNAAPAAAANGAANGARTANGKAEEKNKLLADLKKGGIKVIGKKGELSSLDEKKTRARTEVTVGSLKL